MINNGAIGDTGIGQIIDRRLLTPGGAAAPGVAPEIFPCIVLENDRPEYLYLSGSFPFARGTGSVVAGGAGTRSSVTFYNPTSDTLAVIQYVDLVCGGGNAQIKIGYYGGVQPFGSVLSGGALDTRAQAGGAILGSQSRIITDNTLGAAGGTIIYQSATSFTRDIDIVVAPGGYVYLAPSIDNTAITQVNIAWRERRINPPER